MLEPTTRSATPLRDTWVEFLNLIPWVFVGHFTFRYGMSEERARELFTNYADRILGGFFGRPIVWVAVPEYTYMGRIHFHVLFLGVGHKRAHRVEAERYVLERRWKHGLCKVERLYEPVGALGYALKYSEGDFSQSILSRALRDQLGRNQLDPSLRVN